MNDNGQENKDNGTEELQCSIRNYICDVDDYICIENDSSYRVNYSVCREERQYAVFLYNILRKYSTPESRKECNKEADREIGVEKIFEACGLDESAVVDHVFYEATFMRDFFERNRIRFLLDENGEKVDEKKVKELILSSKKIPSEKCDVQAEKSFNNQLINYVCKWENKESGEDITLKYCGKEVNLGHNTIKSGELNNEKELTTIKINRIKKKIRWMMNAKPDLAVIYHIDKSEPKSLLFLECKFESREDSYLLEIDEESDLSCKKRYSQREVQGMIADFLCNHYLKPGEIQISEKMKNKMENKKANKKSWLVKFIRDGETGVQIKEDKEDKDKKKEWGQIFIGDLIEIENKFFQ